MDLKLYRVCRARKSPEECLKHVNNSTFADDVIQDLDFIHVKACLVMRRRFNFRPETFFENRIVVNYEVPLYNWKYPKCVACRGEFNLFQCVNQSDCQHIFCLGCMLPTMLNTTTAGFVRYFEKDFTSIDFTSNDFTSNQILVRITSNEFTSKVILHRNEFTSKMILLRMT